MLTLMKNKFKFRKASRIYLQQSLQVPKFQILLSPNPHEKESPSK